MSRLHEMMDEIESLRRRGNFRGAENLAKLELKNYEAEGNTPYYNFYRGLLWYLYDFPKEAMAHLNSAVLVEDRDIFYVHKFKGVVEMENGKFASARQFFEEALGEVSGEADTVSILNCLGNTYLCTGNALRARSLYEEALQMALGAGLDEWVATLTTNLGVAFVNQGDNVSSVRYFEDAFRLSLALKDLRAQRICLNNLASAYNNMGKRREALDLFLEALGKAAEINDLYGMRIVNANIGHTYRMMDDVERAMEYYTVALGEAQQINDRQGEAIAKYWIRSLQEGKKRYATH